MISTYLQTIDTPSVPLADGRRIQVLKDIYSLSRCKKHHFAAFISDPPQLIVWHDDPESIMSKAEQIESLLVAMLWRDDNMLESRAVSPSFPGTPHSPGFPLPGAKLQTMRIKEKEVSEVVETGADEEMLFYDGPRKTLIYQSILIGVVGMLIVAAVGVGWRKVAIEVKVDHNYMRFAFAAVFPAQVWLGWFFFQTMVTGISQMIGPVNQILSNSRSYSGIRSKRLNADKQPMPHVTVQCPVYVSAIPYQTPTGFLRLVSTPGVRPHSRLSHSRF